MGKQSRRWNRLFRRKSLALQKRTNSGFQRKLAGTQKLEDRILLDASGFANNECPPNLDLSAVAEQTVAVGTILDFNIFTAGGTVEDLDGSGNSTDDVIRVILDPDIGTDTPTGAVISTDGDFSWTPIANQVGTHTITVIAIDVGSPALADAETFTVTVTGNSTPQLDLNGAGDGEDATATFREDAGAVPIVDVGLTIVDADSTNLSGATVTITNLLNGAAEELAVVTSGTSISVDDSVNGALTLSGTDTVANYQQVLRTLTYNNTSQNPDETARTIEVTVTDDSNNTSTARTSTVSVVGMNDSPMLDAIGQQNVVVNNELVIDLTASDPDDDNLTFSLDPDNSPDDAELTDNGDGTATIRWTPSTVTFPNSIDFRVLVTDDGTPQLSDAELFAITVHEVNQSPNFAAIADQTATVDTELVVDISATDPNTGQSLFFMLDPDDAPDDAVLTDNGDGTAQIRWTPDTTDLPGPISFGVLVFDNGFQSLFDSETFTVAIDGTPPQGLLAESNRFVTEREETVDLGQTIGKQTLSFDLGMFFDTTDQVPIVDDTLNVYLLDAANTDTVLLDGGAAGTPVFSISPTGAEYLPGLVSFDGARVEIDVSGISGVSQALLRFQLLGGDSDTGTTATIGPITTAIDDMMTAGPVLAMDMSAVAPGSAVDLTNYSPNSSIDVTPEHVQYDAATGKYAVNLRLLNQGAAVGRNLAVVFTGLPAAVQVTNASGTDGSGNPYISFSPAIGGGGLASGAISGAVKLLVDNPQAASFSLIGQVLSGPPNSAPQLSAISPITLVPGDYLDIDLAASDVDGDTLSYTFEAGAEMPTGMLTNDGHIIFKPEPGEEGSYLFDVIVSDGVESVSQTIDLTITTDPITTTRVSGIVLDTFEQPIAGIEVKIGSLTTTTAADGTFELESANALPSDTIDFHGETFAGPESYPFVAEKLSLLLGRDIFDNAKNVIGRPVYLPALDLANAVMVDPAAGGDVMTAAIPGLMLEVAAGALKEKDGSDPTGMVEVSVTEVPTELTPAALPANLRPDLVVTIQPAEMIFATPAPLDFPNTAGYAPGTTLNLWSINPETGQFDDVGDMVVSADGLTIETVSGGVNNSSWHFPAPDPDMMNDDDDGDEDNDCDECKATGDGPSRIELHSGAYLEDHGLVTYQSQGQTRGFGLHYDSLRADPRPIVFFGYGNVNPGDNRRIVASLEVQRGNFMYQVPGYTGDEFGLLGGEHIWTVPTTAGPVRGSLQIDMTDAPTGVYSYDLTTGILNFDGTTFAGATATATKQLRHVNSSDSPFGAGWGLTGLERIHENPDGSLLLVNGDGSELFFDAPASGGAPYVSPPGDFSTLLKLGNGTWQRTMTDQTVYAYDVDGRVTSMTDRNGNETTFEYDPTGIIERIIDPVGLATVFATQNGRVTSITDPANRVTTLEYDTEGNLTKVTDPDGTFRTWDYDDNHHIVQEIDKLGRTETTDYNFAGRVVHTVLSDGTETFYSPVQTQYLKTPSATTNPLNPPEIDRLVPISATYSDSNGNVTEVMLDKQGQAVNQRDGQGSLGNVFRNDDNLVQTSGDSRGFTTDFSYDDRGNVLGITDQVGAVTGGSLFVTGHDSDDHSNGEYQRAGLDFLTYGRAASTQEEIDLRSQISVGYLGNGNGTNNGAASSGYTNRTFVDLDDANWADTAFNSNFEILIIGTGGDFVSLAGSTALNGEADQFAEFFNAGGGIYVNTDQADIGQNFYNFLPTFGATQAAVGGTGVYSVTAEGLLIGLTEAIVDADFTHTEYQNVDTNIFRVFETHNQTGDPVAIGLFQGFIGGGFGGVARQFFTYDPNFSQPTSYQDGQGRRFAYEVDSATGNRTKSTRIVGQVDDATNGETDDLVTTMTYTAAGLIDTVTDPLGRTTDYDYNPEGRLSSVTYAVGTPDEATMSYEYDLAGNQIAMIDGNGNRTEFAYDPLNRLTRTTEPDPDGAGPLTSPITEFTYDARGNVETTTDARGNTTTSVFDDKDRLIESIGPDPDGAGPLTAPVTTYAYDLAGNLESLTDPNGNTTEYIYDSRNRRREMIDPDGGVTSFGYDADDNLSRVTDPVGNITRFVYDARSRLVEETDPLGEKITYSYDASDNLTSKTDRNGRETRYAYDDLNRLVTEEWIGPNDTVLNTVAYTYDAVSNLLSVVDVYSALTYTYDARDRVKTVDNVGTPNVPNVILTYAYDDNSNVISVTDTIDSAAGATTGYAYDGLDRLLELTQNGNNVSDKRVDFAYNPLGQYASIDRYSDLTGTQLVIGTDYTYDDQNRLTRIDHQNSGGSSVAFYDYVYDTASRITQITDIDGVTDYSYDDRDQLTGADRDAADARGDESYEYDANGNRVQSSLHGTDYQTGDANRLLSDGTYNYEYDAEGNMTLRTEIASGDYREFVWDHRNRLVAVNDFLADDTPVQEVEFSYDAINRRIFKAFDDTLLDAVDAAFTHFVYDREDVILDFVDSDGTGATMADIDQRYFHSSGTDQVLSQDDGNTNWLLTDRLGSVSDLADDLGNIFEHKSYDSYGRSTSLSSESRYGFTGREFDSELDLAYYRSRFVDYNTGRFLSEDSIRHSSGDLTLYSYANRNPVNFTDPLGTASCDPCKAKKDSVTFTIFAGHGSPSRPKFTKPPSSCGDLVAQVTCFAGPHNHAYQQQGIGIPGIGSFPDDRPNTPGAEIGFETIRARLKQAINAAKGDAKNTCKNNACLKNVQIVVNCDTDATRESRFFSTPFFSVCNQTIVVSCGR